MRQNLTEEQVVEMKVKIVMREAFNHFMSEYHMTVEGLVMTHPEISRERITEIVEETLAKWRTDWEAECLPDVIKQTQRLHRMAEQVESMPLGASSLPGFIAGMLAALAEDPDCDPFRR